MSTAPPRDRRQRRAAGPRRGAGADPFEASLEAIPSPAFLVQATGELVRANARAAALLRAGGDAVRRLLAAPQEGGPTRIPVPGVSGFSLVVLPERPDDPRTRAAAAAQRWGLTPRHRDVLTLVATGATNREIGRALSCTEKTVEAHVSAIFARAAVSSRAELIARVWASG